MTEEVPDASNRQAQVMNEHSYSTATYKPLHVQRAEKTLDLDRMIKATEGIIEAVDQSDDEIDGAVASFLKKYKPNKVQAKRDRGRPSNGITVDATEKGKIRASLYNTEHLKYKRKWLRDMLLSDSDTSDDDDQPVTEARFKHILQEHMMLKRMKDQFQLTLPIHKQEFKDYTWGILGQGPFPAPLSLLELPEIKKKVGSSKASPGGKSGKPSSKKQKEEGTEASDGKKKDADQEGDDGEGSSSQPAAGSKGSKSKKPPTAELLLARRKKLWHTIVKKEIPKASKARLQSRKEMMSNAKKCAVGIQKQRRKEAIAAQRSLNSIQSRMKKICREVTTYWKRFEKEEKLQQKKVQKEAQEQRKQDLNMLEAKRQARKLNFLITQTELYAHFMANKLGTVSEDDKARILSGLEDNDGLKLHDDALDDYDAEAMKDQVLYNAEDAYEKHAEKTQMFDVKAGAPKPPVGFANPTGESDYSQPSIFVGKLKTYQLKGMNWLADLYSQGINGILADEMGLGKTVQSIAFLAHLAEVHGIWGPFLVVAPASTLHNWQQEAARFLPKMRVVPYWGTTQERKILRKFWDQQNLHTEHASFHIVITSYQLIIQDCKYFSRIHWHYMVLDEAQALKSSTSTRWKTLLSFNCRNRLLLTGTPIQNSMAELWALLHFIMPTLFDSHDEFNEWFSKDIESHAENKSTIDQNHLSRLHMILKPFMLRRIKKDVENDLTDKIEVLVYCPLTIRQKYLYDAIKRKIRIEDLLAGVSHAAAASNATSSLMNLVMQFRKVCNHPELFERRDIKTPAHLSIEPYILPKLIYREGILNTCIPSKQHILYRLLYIHNTEHVHNATTNTEHSTTTQSQQSHNRDNLFSWLRLAGLSGGELNKMMITGIFSILSITYQILKERRLLQHQKTWQTEQSQSTPFMCRRMLLLNDELPTDHTRRHDGDSIMSNLVFTNYTTQASSHLTHNLYLMKETQAHRKIRAKHNPALLEEQTTPALVSPVKGKRAQKTLKVKSPPPVITAEEDSSSTKELGSYDSVQQKLHKTLPLQLTDIPTFLTHLIPKAFCAPLQCYCSDRSAQYDTVRHLSCGSIEVKQLLRFGPSPYHPNCWYTDPPGGLEAIRPPCGFSNVYIPDKRSMIVDAGKMHVLDELLTKLKKEGHRVLIYSTMTKVIDLLEEFMWYRKHQYMRLDGSSKISERRDMVSDFQNKTDIFVFLLSTRAGGLGINLTAADTVIFYDSDWNPTVDAQAMDRAHRLGQTKQVTVYRLICKGTIEERILERAREKSEIQRMVISGNNDFKPDILKAKEVVSLLIDDESLKKKLEQAQDTKQDRIVKRKQAAAQKKAEGPKPKRVRKPPGSAVSTPRGTPLSHTNLHMNGGGGSDSAAGSDHLDIVDIMADDISSSRASSPAVSSAPSTPSMRASTPSTKTAGRNKPPPKRSAASRGSSKSKSAAGLKKKLQAGENAKAKK